MATVRSRFTKSAARMSRRDIVAEIVVREDLAVALTGIEEWSHLIILFWMDQLAGKPDRLTTHPRHRADLPEVGVYCARGPGTTQSDRTGRRRPSFIATSA
ncbi:MAG TPA: TrmO family methyltransferase, partial [Casimicrobiaceae bacterium]